MFLVYEVTLTLPITAQQSKLRRQRRVRKKKKKATITYIDVDDVSEHYSYEESNHNISPVLDHVRNLNSRLTEYSAESSHSISGDKRKRKGIEFNTKSSHMLN